ncbi:MAG: mono/diheme cytochrome c family protein [Mariniblastus sp.]|jgi:mono/diheme cytochrome c family protein
MKPYHLLAVRVISGSILWLVFASSGGAAQAQNQSEPITYNRHIRETLSNNCFYCHGPDEEHREAGMRLDIPDEADFDEVLVRISSTDPDEVMPPPSSHKKLSGTQIENLKTWIEAGAVYEDHWAFVTPQRAAIPEVDTSKLVAWSEQPIDRFVLARLNQASLQPTQPADKRTLIRRVAFDLTGLPPTRAEIQTFLDDQSETAYPALVDRLLAKPQYGEHMARYWLDLVRFADTNGLHHDHYREMTPYRDWVIRAFNDNLNFDQFITDQIAGDLHVQPTVDQEIASGFNRLHLIIDRGTALPEESFNRNVVDRVSAVGTAFLGLTVQCAVCHDHKYDPITQKDFYQLYAFFNNFDGGPETGGRNGLDFNRGLQAPYLELPTPAQASELAAKNLAIKQLEAELKTIAEKLKQHKQAKEKAALVSGVGDTKQPVVKAASDDSLADTQQQLETNLKTVQSDLDRQKKSRDALVMEIPATLVMKERAEVKPAHIMIRGAYDQPGEVVERDTPGFLLPMKDAEGVKTRMDLAKWLVDPSHPLTARVAVNRFWQQLFGVGLVRTSEDFGAQGETPSHPELLDHLTVQFVESGWEVKSLLRSIVLSQTYRQTSVASRERYIADPDNRQLARGSRFRLDAEMIRDQALAVSGLLNPKLYGKSVKPPQPDGLWKIVAMPSSYPNVFVSDKGDEIYRRSVYTFWKRGLPPPQMTIFDAPARESCIARRERTNTPLQSLMLMNESQYFGAAMHLAMKVVAQAELTDNQKIVQVFESITSQNADQETMVQLNAALEAFRSTFANDVESAKAMLAGTGSAAAKSISDSSQQVEVASWTMLVHSLLNLDATKTRE